MKFVLLFALFVVSARSAPLGNEVTSSLSQKDAADDKANYTYTDSGSAWPKSTRFYGYNGYPYAPAAYSYPSTPLSYGYNQFSSPLMHPQPSSYGYSSAAVLPYGYGSAFPYMRDQSGLPSNAKTIGHLRGLRSPLLYNAQPQMYAQPEVYALPAVSSYSQHAYQPYAYSGYPSAYYGSYGYDSYSPLYRRSADEVEVAEYSKPSLQPTVNYQTKYIVDQPQVIQYQPAMSETGARAASLDQRPNIIAYNVIPTNAGLNQVNQLEEFRGSDVVLDDKMQLKFSPQYLLNRYHAQMPTPFSRAAADEPQLGAFQGPTDPEDKVFIEFNQNSGYQPESNAQVMQSTAKAVDETAYYPASSQNWGYSYAAPMSVAGAGQGNLPFSQDSIRMEMQRYYEAQYQKQIAELYKRGNQRSGDELPGFGNQLDTILKNGQWNKMNAENQEVKEIPSKAEEPKDKH